MSDEAVVSSSLHLPLGQKIITILVNTLIV